MAAVTTCSEFQFSSVQSLRRVRLFATPWTAAHQASLSIANSRSLLKLMSIESVMPSSHLIFCHPLLLPPSIFPSIRVFSKRAAPPREDTAWPDPRAEDPEINDLPLPPVGATLPSSAAGALLLIPQPSQRVGGETPGLAKATPCIPPPPQAWLPAARCLQPFLGS